MRRAGRPNEYEEFVEPGPAPRGTVPRGRSNALSALASLQRSAGNQATTRLLQAKLRVGAVNDPAELEADEIARAFVEGQPAAPLEELDGPDSELAPRLQPGSGPGGGEVDEGFSAALTQSSGRPLDAGLRRDLERHLGHDLSGVRVHDDARAAALSESIGAEAFTQGRDIYFGAGRYSPTTSGGRELVAHEAAHVVQQGGAVRRKPGQATKTAKVTSISLNTLQQANPPGHVMTFDMNLDLGAAPAGTTYDPGLAGKLAHDLYGAKFEWWEEIILDYDFTEADPATAATKKSAKEGKDYKPWSDIYLVNPTSMTFARWKSSIEAAAGGTLSGKHTTGVQDKPALQERANRYTKRILRFRIITTDSDGFRKEIYATQVLEIDDGVLVRSIYEDTTGNKLVAGTGPQADPSAGFTKGFERAIYVPGVPVHVLTEGLPAFKQKIAKGKAKDFDNLEYDATKKALKTAGSDTTVGSVAYALKNMSGSNRSFNVPVMPNGKWVQQVTAGGGLLVAHLDGSKQPDLVFYTDGTTSKRDFQDLSGNKHSIDARQFEQIDVKYIWGMQ